MKRAKWTGVAIALGLVTAAIGSVAVETTPAQEGELDLEARYEKRTHMVPMRDGTRLFTQVFTPRDTTRDYLILLYRTPYSIAPYGEDQYPDQLGPAPEFDQEGYIFVFQDVRGKYGSEGEFEVIEPLYTRLEGFDDEVDESTDTWDTIDWLVNNLDGHNGRVGQWGISYSGWETVMGMAYRHPALRAASPQASPSDMFIGDDWHHNGAFRLMYAFYWLSFNASSVDVEAGEEPEPFDYGTPWGYRFFLEGGSAASVAATHFGSGIPAWQRFIDHPNYDDYWKQKNALRYLDQVDSLPVLNVAGWYDAEDFYGPMSIYETIEEENPENRSTLVVGPWSHGGWSGEAGDHLGCVAFDAPTSRQYQQRALFPFFESHLRETDAGPAPEVLAFQTGTNRWREFDAWPPPDTSRLTFYLASDGRLSREAPGSGANRAAADSFPSDPSNPVPFSEEIRTNPGHRWMIEDQRFASTRPDVLVYQTEPLEEAVTLAGPPQIRLDVSTTGSAADWVVKLVDVYPGDAENSEFCSTPMGDFQMLVAPQIFRSRYRNSYEVPEPLSPNEVTEIDFELPHRFHTFEKGHRIMVQVQSTWFPVYDRNPQSYVENIYTAEPSDYRTATHRIHRSAGNSSHIVLPVLRK